MAVVIRVELTDWVAPTAGPVPASVGTVVGVLEAVVEAVLGTLTGDAPEPAPQAERTSTLRMDPPMSAARTRGERETVLAFVLCVMPKASAVQVRT